MEKRKILVGIGIFGLVAVIALSTIGVWAAAAVEVEPIMNYQGRLHDNDGNPVNGLVNMEFRLYDVEAGGMALWSETKAVDVVNGLFSTDLSNLDVADFDQALWLEIEVASGILSPRQQLLGAPYAFSLVPGAIVDGSVNGPALTLINEGGAILSGGLRVHSAGWGVRSTALDGTGVYAYSGEGDGIRAYSSGSDNFDDGVYAYSNRGRGVYGRSTNNTGVYGKSSDNYGGYFEGNDGVYGDGIYGVYGSGSTYGVFGSGDYSGGYFVGNEGDGVRAHSFGSDSNDDAVYAYSSNGRGVYAYSNDNIGVYGKGRNNYGGYFEGNTGVYGDGFYGVYGRGSTYGVIGISDDYCGLYARGHPTHYAAYLNGDVFVDGSIFKSGACAFVKDHPTDPTKEIIYVCLEGGETGTYTRGSAQLTDGIATVKLPEDFTLVTSSEGLTVQATPTADCNGLYVSKKSNSTIVVAELGGGTSDATFDYLVNGIRIGYEDYQPIQDRKEERRDPGLAPEHVEEEPFVPPERPSTAQDPVDKEPVKLPKPGPVQEHVVKEPIIAPEHRPEHIG